MQKLVMRRYVLQPGGEPADQASPSFQVMINPAKLTRSSSIAYSERKALGSLRRVPKFSAVGKETLGFAIVLDATGAVPAPTGGAPRSVCEQLAELGEVVYGASSTGDISRVKLVWGTLVFYGRLDAMTTNYTLFAPDGTPLRADVDLKFSGASSAKEAELVADRSSPQDLAQQKEVTEGQDLRTMCQEVYGDESYYLEVARFNGLGNVRSIKPGTVLMFPPLEAA
jgi:hypothetical protein